MTVDVPPVAGCSAAQQRHSKALAEAIHVHVNTAHYRLNRIAEQTGRDLRHLSDVLDLVIAIRCAAAQSAPRAP